MAFRSFAPTKILTTTLKNLSVDDVNQLIDDDLDYVSHLPQQVINKICYDLIDRESLAANTCSTACDELLSDTESEVESDNDEFDSIDSSSERFSIDDSEDYTTNIDNVLKIANRQCTRIYSDLIDDEDMNDARELLNNMLNENDIEPNNNDWSIQNAELAYELSVMRERETAMLNLLREQVRVAKRHLNELVTTLHDAERIHAKRICRI